MYLGRRSNWRPAASITDLKIRAEKLAQIRRFFAERGVWEVETPLLGKTTIPDPNIHSVTVYLQRLASEQPFYLQTSPEFYMKRLLAAGSGSIYQMGKVFRGDEQGRYHHPEFTMLEWYRVDWRYYQLMDEVAALCQHIVDMPAAQRITYAELFTHYLNLNPHTATTEELAYAAHQKIEGAAALDLERDGWLNLLLAEIIEPQLNPDIPTFVYDFPASQAALAQIRNGDPPVAERFELYYQGLELANGFQELTDAKEQRQRFVAENQKRKQQGLPEVPIDEALLTALESGFPYCAGVAVGVDRLMMLAVQAEEIGGVMAFK